MAQETTLIILKPDAVQRGLMGSILSRFESKGLTVVGGKFIMVPRTWPKPITASMRASRSTTG